MTIIMFTAKDARDLYQYNFDEIEMEQYKHIISMIREKSVSSREIILNLNSMFENVWMKLQHDGFLLERRFTLDGAYFVINWEDKE